MRAMDRYRGAKRLHRSVPELVVDVSLVKCSSIMRETP